MNIAKIKNPRILPTLQYTNIMRVPKLKNIAYNLTTTVVSCDTKIIHQLKHKVVVLSKFYTLENPKVHIFEKKFSFSRTLLILMEKLLIFTDLILIFTEYTKNQDFSRKCLGA